MDYVVSNILHKKSKCFGNKLFKKMLVPLFFFIGNQVCQLLELKAQKCSLCEATRFYSVCHEECTSEFH